MAKSDGCARFFLTLKPRSVKMRTAVNRRLPGQLPYIGLDVHQDSIAVAEAGKREEVREYGKIANAPAALRTLVTKLVRSRNELRFWYEAGPCGYGIQRQLTLAGH